MWVLGTKFKSCKNSKLLCYHPSSLPFFSFVFDFVFFPKIKSKYNSSLEGKKICCGGGDGGVDSDCFVVEKNVTSIQRKMTFKSGRLKPEQSGLVVLELTAWWQMSLGHR